jgi:hypothetical protein
MISEKYYNVLNNYERRVLKAYSIYNDNDLFNDAKFFSNLYAGKLYFSSAYPQTKLMYLKLGFINENGDYLL